MSVQSTDRVAGPYPCNGLTTQFPFDFKVFNTGEVVAILSDANEVESTLALGTDYTIALNDNQDANPGGTLTTLATYVTGYKVTLTSEVPNTQPETLTNQGGFYPKVIEHALDRLTIQVQQVDAKANRAVQVPISSDTLPNELLTQLKATATAMRDDILGSGSVPIVADHIDNIDAVADSAANISTVADNIADIIEVANNLSDILAALYGTPSGALMPANNLSDLANPATARANLGLADLGSIA